MQKTQIMVEHCCRNALTLSVKAPR
ncbi:MAG: hypothetical protein K0Q55_1457, partial [Verrucomicrobia bacterium]|nr:hypothetical protein [Verrucomicrobiota bacterium]